MKNIFDLRGKLIAHLEDLDRYSGPGKEMSYNEELYYLGSLKTSIVPIVANDTPLEGLRMDEDMTVFRMLNFARESKTILFRQEQALILLELAKKKKIDMNIPYRLPFSSVLVQFDRVTQIDLPSPLPYKNAGGMLLSQDEFGWCEAHLIFSNLLNCSCSWDVEEDYVLHGDISRWTDIEQSVLYFAYALVLFVNSDNIELVEQRNGESATSAKHSSRKSPEPYYICRIKNTRVCTVEPNGVGVKHGIRYDVRGHFRRQTNGKTTWVRPHQRGLQNELYVPKTYVVAKEPRQ